MIAAQASTFVFGIDSVWLRLLSVVGMAATLIVAIEYLLRRQDASYSKRITSDEAILWDVRMNGAEVGCIAGAAFAAIQQLAFRGGRNELAQLLTRIRTFSP